MEVGSGGLGVCVAAGVSEGRRVGEAGTGVAVGGSAGLQEAVNAKTSTNRNEYLFIESIVAQVKNSENQP